MSQQTCARRVGVFLLLAMAACVASLSAAPEPVDPLVGNWVWHRKDLVTFKPEGPVHVQNGYEGTWQYLHNPEVQRHYRISWDHGNNVDELICSEDAQRAHIRNQSGLQFDVKRAASDKLADSPTSIPDTANPANVAPGTATATVESSDPADPILGDWRWFRGWTVKFMADGTMTNSNGASGTWTFQHNSEADRKYVLNWNHGAFIDHLSYNLTARTGHLVNQIGDQFNVTQGAAMVPDKPANYFGVPGR